MKMDQDCVLARPQRKPQEQTAFTSSPTHAYMLALVPYDAVIRNTYQQMFRQELDELSPDLQLTRETPPHIPLITFALSGSPAQQQNKISQIWNQMAQLAADHGELSLTFASINTRRPNTMPDLIEVVQETMPSSEAQILRAGLQAVLSNHRVINATAYNAKGQRLQLPLARIAADDADHIPEKMPDMLGIGRQAKFQLRWARLARMASLKPSHKYHYIR